MSIVEIDHPKTVGAFDPDDIKFLETKFSKIEEAFIAYANYAHKKGFAVITDYQTRRKDDTSIIGWAHYTCSKFGFHKGSPNDPRNNHYFLMFDCESSGGTGKRKQHEVKIGCKVDFRIHWDKKACIYFVKSLSTVHNHPLHSLSKVRFLRSNRKVDEASHVLAEINQSVGIPTLPCTQPAGIPTMETSCNVKLKKKTNCGKRLSKRPVSINKKARSDSHKKYAKDKLRCQRPQPSLLIEADFITNFGHLSEQ